jgi:tetratricopeptide (TPR) repeat protein
VFATATFVTDTWGPERSLFTRRQIEGRFARAAASPLDTPSERSRAQGLVASVLRRWPEVPEANIQMARVAWAGGDIDGGLYFLERALSVERTNATLWMDIARGREKKGDLHGARAAVHEALRREPHYGEAQWTLARLLKAMGRPRESRRLLEGLARRPPLPGGLSGTGRRILFVDPDAVRSALVDGNHGDDRRREK